MHSVCWLGVHCDFASCGQAVEEQALPAAHSPHVDMIANMSFGLEVCEMSSEQAIKRSTNFLHPCKLD